MNMQDIDIIDIVLPSLDEMMQILKAAQDGEQIQYKSPDEPEWTDLSGESYQFNFAWYYYRIKPKEPREWWIVFLQGVVHVVGSAEEAYIYEHSEEYEVVRVREVL